MEADAMRRLTLALVVLAVLLTCFGCAPFRDRSDSKLVSLQSQASGFVDIPLTPAFDPLVYDYTIGTPGSQVYFTAVAQEGAGVTYTPTLGYGSVLTTGETWAVNTMTIVVTSEDGSTTTTYTIIVTRTLP
jgi:hypothetical protein